TGATTQPINLSNSGNYTVTVSNANACTASSSPTQVTVLALPPTPLIIPSGPTIFCQGNSVILNSNAANTYLWSTGATTQAINVSNSGNYTVTVSNANACTASSSPTQVTVLALPPAPLITPNGPTIFCQGNSVMLNSNAANTYLWSTGATTQTINVSNSGNYTVTISNANDCTASSSATQVTVHPLPLPPVITMNGNVLSTNNATGIQWFLNGGIIANATGQSFTPTQSGNYTVSFTDANGCQSESAVFQYTNTGIETISESNIVLIIPNPNDGRFQVEFRNKSVPTHPLLIEVYNLLGQKVFMADLKQIDPLIDISSQPSGTYFVKIISANWKGIKKVLKI
ncbi:MAG: T9SS type A sorting domain-containing protein, partial [Saprospiraceae bacterium]